MERRTRPARARTAVLALLAMTLSLVGVAPAVAAPPTGSASLVSGAEILAGTQNATFRIEVDYPQADGVGSIVDPKQPVDAVQVVPPTGLLTSLEGRTEGWSWTRPSGSERLILTGGQIAPGGSQVFEFTADVGRPHEDVARDFDVFLSDDGGASYTQATDDGLITAVRILKITAVEVAGPAGVTDGTATTDQPNVLVDVHLANEGAPLAGGPSAVNVETTLTGAKSEVTRAVASPYGDTVVVGFRDVTMPSTPGEIVLGASAEATDVTATAIDDVQTPLTLLRKLALSYRSGSLAPRAVIPARVPGAPAYAFEAGFDVTGDVDVALSSTDTAIRLNPSDPDNTFRAALAGPTAIANDAGAQTLSFESSLVDMADGDDYPVEIRVVGTDENDAPVDLVPSISDTVDVDGLLPVVLPDIIGDASNLDAPDEGEEEVTSAGRIVEFGGEVNRADTGGPCTDCTITDAFLEYTFLDGTTKTVGLADANGSISLDAGRISGSAEVTEAAAEVVDVALWVTAARTRSATSRSSGLLVDNVDPGFVRATTGQVPDFYSADHEPRRVVMVEIDESVKFNPSALASDWYVDDVSVTRVEAFRNDGTATSGHADVLVLHVSSDLPDNQTPQVRYEPGRGLGLIFDGNRGRDQVERALADQALEVVDGIVPDLADLVEVNDRIQQDDAFWTNTTAPSFTLEGIAVGDLVTLYNRRADGSLERIGSAERDPNQDTVVINDAGSYTFTGVTHGDVATVAAEVTDPAGNSSGLAEFDVVFDFVAPTVQGLLQSGRDVTVSLSEPLTKDDDWVGRNFASDWAAEQGAGFSKETFAATSVARQADVDGQGTLTVTFEEDAATAALERVIYEFLSELGSGKRYEDRAGNQLLDFTHDVGP